jgi:hypothetical protein
VLGGMFQPSGTRSGTSIRELLQLHRHRKPEQGRGRYVGWTVKHGSNSVCKGGNRIHYFMACDNQEEKTSAYTKVN